MAVRTTVDIPEPLHEVLRRRSQRSGASIRSLVVRALEQAYVEHPEAGYVTGPPVAGKGKLGSEFPVDENPHDLVLS